MELTFGEQIKIILKRKNMTIRQLAELVEVQTGKPMSRQNLTQKLNRDNFQEQDMKEVAQALGCMVKISVIDPMETAAQASPGGVVPQNTAEETMQEGHMEKTAKGEAATEQGRTKSHTAGRYLTGRLRTGRPGGYRPDMGPQGLAKQEAAVTRQPLTEEEDVNADLLKEIESALMESIQKELNTENRSAKQSGKRETAEAPEMDHLAWAKKKPSVWPKLTVPKRAPENIGPPLPGEMAGDLGSLSDGAAMPGMENRPEAKMRQEPEGKQETEGWPETGPQSETEKEQETEGRPDTKQQEAEGQWEVKLRQKAEILPEESGTAPPLAEKWEEEELSGIGAGSEKESNPEEEPFSEEKLSPEKKPVSGGKPFSEEEPILKEELPFAEDVMPELLPEREEAWEGGDLEEVSLGTADDSDDLEFFNLEDFYGGEEISRASAPYIMKREKPEEKKRKPEARRRRAEREKTPEKRKLLRREKALRPFGQEKAKPKEPEENRPEKEEAWNHGFEMLSENAGGDVSFASAPYVLQREPETGTADTGAEEIETVEPEGLKAVEPEKESDRKTSDERPAFGRYEAPEEEEAAQEENISAAFQPFGNMAGSGKGDISSVSAPYIIPREPEEEPEKELAKQIAYENGIEEEEEEPEEWNVPEEEPEEEAPVPDMEEKIASWDAAVKRQLENPFRSFEGRRARRTTVVSGLAAGAGTAESPGSTAAREESAGGRAKTGDYPGTENRPKTGDYPETENRPGSGGYPETENRPKTGDYPGTENRPGSGDYSGTGDRPETEDSPGTGEVLGEEGGLRLKEREETEGHPAMEGPSGTERRQETEKMLDLQGPAIDPDTGLEYETNTVKHHPFEPDMLLVYDQDEHRWIVQAERAFLNFQINKRALLGKDYEPPVYLD